MSPKKKKSKAPVLTEAEIQRRHKLRQAALKYHKVRKAVIKELDAIDADLTKEERRNLIHSIYVSQKEKSLKKILIRDIKKYVDDLYGVGAGKKRVPELEYFNPLKIPLPELTGINWWELDDFISTTLVALVTPLNLRFEVNAGNDYGSTPIMSLLMPNGSIRYNYMISGVEQIIEKLRSAIENKSGPEWVGEPMLRPGFEDNGQADSYFIQFSLVDEMGSPYPTTTSYEAAEFELPEPSPDQIKKRRKEVLTKEEELEKIRKDLAAQKEKRKRKRPDQKEKIEPKQPVPAPPPEPKGKQKKVKPPAPEKETAADKRAKNVERILDIQKAELKDLENLFRDGLLTKKEFLEERRAIMSQTNSALDKFQKGGKV